MYEVTYPQSLVKINGHTVPCVGWEVENNAADTADTFKLTLCQADLDKSSVTSEYLFYTQDDIYVEIYLGFAKSAIDVLSEKQMDLMLTGFVDKPEWDFSTGELTLGGRDKTALLLDNQASVKFSNKTVEEVLREYASKRGLSLSIDPSIVGHTKKVGKISNGEYTMLADGYTEWDLLSKLALEENRELFVRANTLYYRPKLTPSDKEALHFKYADSLEKLKIDRTLKNTKGIEVTVRGYNKNSKTTVAKKATLTPDIGRVTQPSQNNTHKKAYKANYVVNVPNLTPEQAKNYAQNLAHDIHDHELNVSFTVPTRPGYDINKTVYIDDVPILAKQYFVIKRITTSFGSGGVRSNFECVNHLLAYKGKKL